jgi:hypothetical protein
MIRRLLIVPAIFISFILAVGLFAKYATADGLGAQGISSPTYNAQFRGHMSLSTAGTAITNPLGWQNLLQITSTNYPAISFYKTAATAIRWDLANNDGIFSLYNGNLAAYAFTVWSGTNEFTMNANFVIATTKSPANNAACNTGEITWATGFIYVCVSTNSWRRVALSTY